MESGRELAIYSRKSRFTGKGESIGNQLELCRAYIRDQFGEEAARTASVFEDEGFSGGDLNRPQFRAMMEGVEARRFRAVVVYRLDRISRNVSDFTGLIDRLTGLGVDFVSIRESFDTATPMGRAMMYIASVFSQLERETIAERIRDNLRELAKTGRWLGGITPTGYASEQVETVTIDGKKHRACRLRLIPEEGALVQTLFRVFRETGSLTGAEGELARRGLCSKNGKPFTRWTLRAILQNPVYLRADQRAQDYFKGRGAEVYAPAPAFDGVRGMLAYHRTLQKKGRAAELLPVEEWIMSVGEHPGLIPSEEWIGVQETLERNGSKAYRQPRRNTALLTGLLRCRCGGRMYPKLTGRSTPEGEARYTYFCKRREQSHGLACTGKSVDGNRLDALVLSTLASLPEDSAALREALGAGRRTLAAALCRDREGTEALAQRRDGLRCQMDALLDALSGLGEGGARAEILHRLDALHREAEELEAQLARRDREKERLPHPLRFAEAVGEMDTEEKRDLMRALLAGVVWDGETAEVLLREGLSSPGSSGEGRRP